MIRIVFFDVDGTLLSDKVVPDSTRQAISLLQAQGITTALATGRPEFELHELREQLSIDWAITCNGAHLGHRGQTVTGTAFSTERIDEWVELAQRTPGHTLLLYGAQHTFSTSSIADCPYLSQADEEIGFLEPIPVSEAGRLPAIYQCILFAPEEEASPYTERYADELYLHRWHPWALDLTPQGINKSTGVQLLLDRLGISHEEAAAFGDGKNDLEMIQHVGLGIAMGNSCPELLACARHVTAHVKDDGILQAVTNLILPKSLRV